VAARANIKRTLGTTYPVGASQVVLFIPDHSRDDEAGGRLLKEQTVMVVSYVAPKLLTPATLKSLREFLHRFGRETRQGEVGIVIDSKYYGISRYDVPKT